MINATRVEAALRTKYPKLEKVSEGIFRATDVHANTQYAVRYFDLRDNLHEVAGNLRGYQESLLSDSYFAPDAPTHLRWNHYLYFVASEATRKREDFGLNKATVEGDREYARKRVLLDSEVSTAFAQTAESPEASLPADLSSIWAQQLDSRGLGYVLDASSTVPAVTRRIAAGDKDKLGTAVATTGLASAERAASEHFLESLSISGFRSYPLVRDHSFGTVNLIYGTNGVGKTSLLDAIEYLYCGQNRREGPLLRDTCLTGKLTGTGEILITRPSTSRSQLRARHANWYSKTELRTLTLCNSFGKFNYLDTDAAVKLSVETSEEQIGSDVARLVLGPEAEQLSDRLLRVDESVCEQMKERSRDSLAKQQLLTVAQRRMEALKAAPHRSDEMFRGLVMLLSQLKWRAVPLSKDAIGNLRESLSQAMTYMLFLSTSSIDVLAMDDQEMAAVRKGLVKDVGEATNLENKRAAIANKVQLAHTRRTEVEGRMALYNRLTAYASSGFQTLAENLSLRQRSIEVLRRRVSNVEGPLPDIPQIHLSSKLSDARQAYDELWKAALGRVAESLGALRGFEASQSELIVLRQELLATAAALFKLAPDPKHCPLCATHFESGELLRRMALQRNDAATSVELARLQTNRRDAESESETMRKILVVLTQLMTFVDNSATATVQQVLDELRDARSHLASDELVLLELRRKMDQLTTAGLKREELQTLLRQLGLEALPSAEDIARQIAELKISESDLATRHGAGLQELRETESVYLQKILEASIESDHKTQALSEALRARLSDLEEASSAKAALHSILSTADISREMLRTQLAQANELWERVVTEIATEKATVDELSKEAKSAEALDTAIERLKKEIGRLRIAHDLISGLLSEGSSGAMAARVLAENAASIASTFAGIHMPNEFDLSVHADRLKIIRRDSNRAVDLQEMSTGQRAAFALSLFIAMNLRLNSGPKLVLFDDPVAHVDDVNVLSFLDHLREMALRGTRQIFFATADAKLAGLFRHKFQFLGSSFKDIELSRS